MGVELSIDFWQTVGRYKSDFLHRYTNIGKAEIFLKTKEPRQYKIALLLITQGGIQSVEQEILSAKVKPDGPIQNLD